MTVPRIVVVGSINMDLVTRMAHLPRPGETVHGDDLQTIPGGKGANQAVAAARMNAHVTMIGRVGDDAFGVTLRQSLDQYGVSTDHVETTSNCSSGVAIITVDRLGANAIVVIAGANGRLTAADIDRHADVIAAADALIVQLETPIETVAKAIQIAKRAGVKTILDPAPAPESALPEELRHVDLISPNQREAEALTGIAIVDHSSAERAARQLQQQGFREVVLKLGDQGALVCSADGQMELAPTRAVNVVDTTAAGDAFTAALAVGLSEGRSLIEAARLGCAAGTLACTKFGAQPAMPTRAEVDQFVSVGE